jgi:hypothetical protein
MLVVKKAGERLAARPIPAGWALDAVLRCDEAHAGFHSFLCRASNLRRQGAFMALSQLERGRPEVLASAIKRGSMRADWVDADPFAIIAQGLMSIRVKNLVQAIFGSSAEGLVGTLSRCRDNPLDELTYDTLFFLHDDPKERRRADLLRQVERVTDDVVEVVWRLPAALLRKEVLLSIRRPEDVGRCNSALTFIRRLHPGLTDEDLCRSLSQIGVGSNFAIWVRRWVDRADTLPPAPLPYAGDEALKPLVSASDLKEAGRRHGNCLASKATLVALGRVVYYDFRGHGGAVAEVVALSEGRWLLDSVYGPKNGRPAPEAVKMIRASLQAAGVLVAARHTHGHEVGEVAKMLRVSEFDGGSWLDIEPVLDVAA